VDEKRLPYNDDVMDEQRLTPDLLRLLRGSEVAQALGVSRALAYKWMASGVLPTVRRGRVIRVPQAALQAWIAKNTKQPAA
jgi:excisionase family DNA binding protein